MHMNQIEHNIALVKKYLLDLQNHICQELSNVDGKQCFQEDYWQHSEGGEGFTRVLTNGGLFEKGGINFSHVTGKTLPSSATTRRFELADCPFQALGISLVMHPWNPYIPTSHMNLRFFITTNKHNEAVWWFGGGFDLTPYYGFVEDCQHWHDIARSACDPFGLNLYPHFKKWCDQYFYLPHRQEPRGIGGLFFDDINEWGFEKCFAFIQSIGKHYLLAYLPIVNRRKVYSYSQKERDFQLYRRGRYVEFNLLYDRGTLFGIQSGGRYRIYINIIPTSSELAL